MVKGNKLTTKEAKRVRTKKNHTLKEPASISAQDSSVRQVDNVESEEEYYARLEAEGEAHMGMVEKLQLAEPEEYEQWQEVSIVWHDEKPIFSPKDVNIKQTTNVINDYEKACLIKSFSQKIMPEYVLIADWMKYSHKETKIACKSSFLLEGIIAFARNSTGCIYGMSIKVRFNGTYKCFLIQESQSINGPSELEILNNARTNGAIYPYWLLQGIYMVDSSGHGYILIARIKTDSLLDYIDQNNKKLQRLIHRQDGGYSEFYIMVPFSELVLIQDFEVLEDDFSLAI
jgi:hypothetical protein